MKQILHNFSNGETELIECPVPASRKGHLLIDTIVSLVSTGTERMLVDFGKAGLIAKARQQPDKVVQVLEKARTDGVLTTIDAVRSKLSQPIPLGYCNVGQVHSVGDTCTGFVVGDRVVSNGPHADVVNVPVNLCAKIPDAVSDEAASFTVVAAIGLQGIRLAKPTLGESFVVTGVGLIGLLTVQLLRAQGCRVMAIDFDPAKLELARKFGVETCNPAQGEDPVEAAMAFSRGRGVDGVIITASTATSEPVSQAARMCRKRGRIILVGVTGLELNRSEFYEKELSFQVSCSYGPGRYDPEYEQKGRDYPLAFVRWTEQRNFEAVLDLMAQGSLDTEPLVSHRYRFADAPSAYDLLSDDKTALGILLEYDGPVDDRHRSQVPIEKAPVGHSETETGSSNPAFGFIGAGNYASRMLIPAFRRGGAQLEAIVSAGGTSSTIFGRRNGFARALSSTDDLFADPKIDAAVVATRHDSHSQLTCDALSAGKHVFVEKPLALDHTQLAEITAAHAGSDKLLMVGFNRRFSPLVQTMSRLLRQVREPKNFVFVMNAGAIPTDHWTQDSSIGGGRIIGEACHLIDLMRYLADAPITDVTAMSLGQNDAISLTEDKASVTLRFADGSLGTVHYLANGGSAFPKERVEVFTAGRTLQLDNFVRLTGYNWPGFRKQALWRQDKGQDRCARAFIEAVENGGDAPIPADELFEVARISIEAAEQLRS